MGAWNLPDDVTLVDIKKTMFSSEDLAVMRQLAGSYEALLSKRSQTFLAQGLKNTIKSDADYGALLPQDYTFLKRPIFVYDEAIFIGNSAKTDVAVKEFLSKLSQK